MVKENSLFNLKKKFIQFMSWVRIWVHLVFATKNRSRFLHEEEVRKLVFEHIKKNAKEKNIWLDCVNGSADHAHCLISLGREQSISNLAQLIKGESSFWINKNKLVQSRFSWQDDFWGVGVSESALESTRSYIYNQEQHHKIVSFDEELEEFLRVHGFEHFK